MITAGLADRVSPVGQQPIVVDRTLGVPPESWDCRVSSVPEGAYRQTSYYAAYQAHWRREKALYLTAFVALEPVGQLLALLGGVGAWGMARRPLSSVTLPLARWALPQMYWMEGPVIFSVERRREVCVALVDAMVEEADRLGCVVVEGMPSFYGKWDQAEVELCCGVLVGKGFQSRKMHTLAVSLSGDQDTLWGNLRRDARNKTRRAQVDGIEIVPLDDTDERLKQAYRVVVETEKRNKTAPLSWEDFRYSFKYHSRHGLTQAFLSVHKGKPLSYQRVVYFNGVAILGGISYSEYSRENHLYGNDLMQWHMIRWAKEAGIRWLDYGGAEPNAVDSKQHSIYQFKVKWGGELIAYDFYRLRGGGAARKCLFNLAHTLSRGRL